VSFRRISLAIVDALEPQLKPRELWNCDGSGAKRLIPLIVVSPFHGKKMEVFSLGQRDGWIAAGESDCFCSSKYHCAPVRRNCMQMVAEKFWRGALPNCRPQYVLEQIVFACFHGSQLQGEFARQE
jgi:hypothetical protein